MTRHCYLWILPDAGHAPVSGGYASHFAANALAFLGGAWSGAA
jgi:hypothetical protein